jgi:hypothetical protein
MNRKSKKAIRGAGRFTVKIAVVLSAVLGGAALVSSSVFASLSAIATSTGSVTSGTLILTDTATAGSGGLVTTIAAMAPGDTVNRYVDLVNGGTLDGDTPTVRILDGTPTALTTDGTAGLQVTISACTVAWTVATGVCSGTATTVLASTSALALASNTGLTLPSKLAASTSRLKIAIALPTGTEVTTNGVLPPGTIQGKSAALTWTFTVQQRTATTTNS